MSTVRIDLPRQTDVGNYFVSNYPPYSRWSAELLPQYCRALSTHRGSGPLGLYVHIPFCRQRCSYCYFRVHTRRPEQEVEHYIDAVLAELDLYVATPAVNRRSIANAYFGGGTPTHLSVEQIRRLMHGLQKHLDWREADEFTCECQPGTVDEHKLRTLKQFGVTRASIGVQTFSDHVLRGVGRAAGTRDCLEAYHLARHVDFPQVNIDLIAGLPEETAESWQRTIDRVLELRPDGVTIYQFELTHNSALYKAVRAGRRMSLPDWPTKRRWVDDAFARLEDAGYTIYGAYWAVRDPERHRYAYVADHYWQGDDLLALGESAFGFLGGHHYQNIDTYGSYTAEALAHRLPLQRAYRMSDEENLRRRLMLQLKTGHVDLNRLRDRFGDAAIDRLIPSLEKLKALGVLDYDRHAVVMSREGLLCVEWLLPELYLPEHRGVRYT